MKRALLAMILFTLSATAVDLAQTQPELLRVTSIRYDRKQPLTEALRIVGLHVQGGFVSFGVDVVGDTEPEVDVSMSDTTLGDALRRITSQIPGYASEVVSGHVVEIYEGGERANPGDVLNLPIREFSVNDVPAAMILSAPTRYIPDLKSYISKEHSELGCGSIGPGLGTDALGVTLSLAGLTVRQILDAVAEADAVLPSSRRFRLEPVGWVHRRTNDAKAGVVPAWSSMSFAPHDWKGTGPLHRRD